MLNPTVLGFKRGTVGLAFIFVTLVNKQKVLEHKTSIPLLLDLLPQKSLSTFDPPFYYQVKKCVKHSLSIKSDSNQ